MTTNPYVELLYSDLQPSAFDQTTSRLLGTPAEQIEAALSTYRLLMINHIKAEIRKTATVTGAELLRLADIAASLYLGRFTAMVGPGATAAYIRAYHAAHTGDVPMDLIYALASQHAERMGKYFNETSKESLSQGFNRMVNKGVPERVAAERALDAFGLTPRQMSGYVALDANQKTHTSVPRHIKANALSYVGRSIRRRLKVFGSQEEHNLDQQAQQVAWMWLLDKGKLSSLAEKVWLTAKDEKVCKVCGPMHGKRVGLTERFTLPGGADIYVPGAHVNCRCEVKLVDPISIVQKDIDFDESEHPRANDGRFKNKYSVAARTKERPDLSALQQFLDQAAATLEEPKTKTKLRPIDITRPISVAAPVEVASPIEIATPIEIGAQTQPLTITNTPVEVLTPGMTLTTVSQMIDVARPVDIPNPETPPAPTGAGQPQVEYLPEPIYTVVSGAFMSTQYSFSKALFYPNELKALSEATKTRRIKIQDEVYDQTSGGRESAEMFLDDPLNGPVSASFSEDELEHIIDLASRHTQDRDGSNLAIPVELFTPGTENYIGTRHMTPTEICQNMNIDPDDFKVRILMMKVVHKKDQGRGSWEYYASNNTFFITGEYEAATPESYAQTDDTGHGYDVFELTPFAPKVL